MFLHQTPKSKALAEKIGPPSRVGNITPHPLPRRCLLITFANSLEPDQVRHNVGPDLDTSYLAH